MTESHPQQASDGIEVAKTPYKTEIQVSVPTGQSVPKFLDVLESVLAGVGPRKHVRATVVHPTVDETTDGVATPPPTRDDGADDADADSAAQPAQSDGGSHGFEINPGTAKWAVCNVLHGDGPLTAGEIADRVDYKRGTVAGTLSQHGDLFAREEPDDGSAGFYRLTDPGKVEFRNLLQLQQSETDTQ